MLLVRLVGLEVVLEAVLGLLVLVRGPLVNRHRLSPLRQFLGLKISLNRQLAVSVHLDSLLLLLPPPKLPVVSVAKMPLEPHLPSVKQQHSLNLNNNKPLSAPLDSLLQLHPPLLNRVVSAHSVRAAHSDSPPLPLVPVHLANPPHQLESSGNPPRHRLLVPMPRHSVHQVHLVSNPLLPPQVQARSAHLGNHPPLNHNRNHLSASLLHHPLLEVVSALA